MKADLAVVLAAGGSTRMGQPKALLPFGGRPIVLAHVNALRPWARRVIVVIGADADRVIAALEGQAEVVENPRWETTFPMDSLRCALSTNIGTAFVTPVDVPPVDPQTARALLESGQSAVPVDSAGHDGHPVVLDALTLHLVRAGSVEGGLRALLRSARRVPGGSATDWDDWPAWTAWRS